jgi:hypothetical protein
MTYTVITKAGFVHVFHIRALAEIYVQAYGGVVVTPQTLVDTASPAAV